jgi:hypothetical protein
MDEATWSLLQLAGVAVAVTAVLFGTKTMLGSSPSIGIPFYVVIMHLISFPYFL